MVIIESNSKYNWSSFFILSISEFFLGSFPNAEKEFWDAKNETAGLETLSSLLQDLKAFGYLRASSFFQVKVKVQPY